MKLLEFFRRGLVTAETTPEQRDTKRAIERKLSARMVEEHRAAVTNSFTDTIKSGTEMIAALASHARPHISQMTPDQRTAAADALDQFAKVSHTLASQLREAR